MKPNIPSGNRNTLPQRSYKADDHTPARPETLPIRDLFLFSCYTGIPYGDMCRLTTEDLEVAEDGEVWIKTARKKTKIDYEVPLLDIPLLILDKYRDMAPEGKLLPMYSNNELNRTLKRLPPFAELNGSSSFTADAIPTPPRSRFRMVSRLKPSVKCWGIAAFPRRRFTPK